MERSKKRARGRPTRFAIELLAIVIATLATASSASASTTGGGVFVGTVSLPSFPCSNCTGALFQGTASLTLSGMATLSLSGVPMPYVAVWAADPGNASAVMSYDENCISGQPGDTPPPEGTASGTFVITGGLLSLAGGPLLSATLTGSLSWLRVGLAAQMTVSDLAITAPTGGSTVAVNLTNTLLVGQSANAFVWTNGPGTCATTQAGQTALVAGIALQPV